MREPYSVLLRGTFAANRIKKFYTRDEIDHGGEDLIQGLVSVFEETVISESDVDGGVEEVIEENKAFD